MAQPIPNPAKEEPAVSAGVVLNSSSAFRPRLLAKTHWTDPKPEADQILVIDLSQSNIAAVLLQRKGPDFLLLKQFEEPASCPIPGRPPLSLRDRLKRFRADLNTKMREAIFLIGMEQSLLRNVEMGILERQEIRRILKLSTRHFFQQDMSDSEFDCFIPAARANELAQAGKPGNFLVAAAPEKVLAEINSAAEFAGFKAIQIVPVQVAFANAALLAKEQLINKDPLVLLHIGTNTSTVSFLFDENITLTRVIRIGREQLARALNQARQTPANLSSEMRSGLIQSNLQHALTPLAHEIRAAIDYFEDLYSQRVSAGFVTGQIALDDLVIESLQVLEIPCQRINSERLFKAVETSRAE